VSVLYYKTTKKHIVSLGKWSPLPAMTTRRSHACAVALHGSVIVIGGIGTYIGPKVHVGQTGQTLKSCEAYQVYNPDFYKFLLLAQKIRECGEKATSSAFEEEVDALLMILLPTRTLERQLWMRLSLLPWDIVVHVVRFVETPSRKKWSRIPAMNTKRSEACAAVVGGQVIVMGGRDEKNRCLDWCESYDPVKKKWNLDLPPMNTKRYLACAVAVDGHIIVMGGLDEWNRPLNCCESYDPLEKKWSYFPSMNTKRYRACAAVVGGRIIAMGGLDERHDNSLKPCESYDPVK